MPTSNELPMLTFAMGAPITLLAWPYLPALAIDVSAAVALSATMGFAAMMLTSYLHGVWKGLSDG